MDRRTFLKTTAGAGAAALAATTAAGAASTPKLDAPKLDQPVEKKPMHLLYAPHATFFSSVYPNIVDRLQRIADEGFEAVENNGFKKLEPDVQQAYGKKIEQLGLTHGIFVANRGVNEGAGTVELDQRDAFLDEIRKSVEVAPIINARWCTVCTGNIPQSMTRPQARINTIEALRRACDIVEKINLTMVVEPLNIKQSIGYFLARSDEAYEIMKAVNHPSCKILFDIYHQQITEGDLIDNIRACWDEIAYFQFADVPGRHEPWTGEINYRNVFKAIYEEQQKRPKEHGPILGAELGAQLGWTDEGTMRAINAIRLADDWD